MAALDWMTVRGCQFTPDEAREASDFSEVLANYGLTPERAYELFDGKPLSPAKRLVFAEKIPVEIATTLLLSDPDQRICAVVNERLREHQQEQNGGLILAT
jgi:hypothetical protein